MTNTSEQPVSGPSGAAIPLHAHPSVAGQLPLYAECCDITTSSRPPQTPAAYTLWLDSSGLALTGPGLRKPFRLQPRRQQQRLAGRSDLVRACGGNGSGRTLLDLFAGFCTDAITLAQQHFMVTSIERHPIVWLLARDFIRRFELAPELHYADAAAWLQRAQAEGQRWDVIYLDPMFPQRRKTALPGLAAQVLQGLQDSAPVHPADPEHCLAGALACAPRVVVKRRRKDPPLPAAGVAPSLRYTGQSVRYDVYVTGS